MKERHDQKQSRAQYGGRIYITLSELLRHHPAQGTRVDHHTFLYLAVPGGNSGSGNVKLPTLLTDALMVY